MDVSQYLDVFIDESKEHLQNLNTQILDLEQEPGNMDTINEIFRAAHTLKGMAGTMGYKRMQNLTHNMENVFSEVRNGAAKVNANVVDVLFQCLDALDEYVTNIQTTGDEGDNDNENLIKAFNDFLAGNEPDENKDAPKAEATSKDESADKQEATDKAEKDDDASWKKIKFAESQLVVMNEAVKEGKHVIGLTVKVQESCILKAARAFLVYKAIEDLGEIIVSNPSAQDIEDEKFDLEFSLIVISDSDTDKLIAAATNVSEIENAVGGYVELDAASSESEKASEQTEDLNKPAVSDNNKPAASEGTGNAPAKAADKKKPVVNRTVRVDIEKLDDLMNLVSELIIAKNSLVSAATTKGASTNNVNEQIEYLESVTTNLHESVMKVRMVPIESVVNKFPRMIRDLQKKLNKKMELYMSGEETELDRTVVDEIGDPLMHLLRNSADHGIENDVALRKERGKPETGSIWLDAYQDGNNVVIEVRDDGNGIDVAAVRNKAIERGTITEEQAASMSDAEITNLLFLPSFSTAKQVSDISGRGVGLDVVKSKIESLSGEVDVKSVYGEGSKWTIRLPLTLAIIQSLMVVIGGEKYAIPLGNIQTIESVVPEEIKTVQHKEVINLRGSVIPIIRLNEVLDCESTRKPDEDFIVVVVKKGDVQAGLVIDELTGQQEIVIKSLGKYINKSKVISGATILGDGEVALIIDPNALI
ncbi:MAG: chemotaxis protein CheA [Lachnospiraceae bacterium]|nr:chemotaxis protein CheA [Lachnospiraceae bacterium]